MDATNEGALKLQKTDRESIERWARSDRRGVVEVRGNSMAPFLKDGFRVVVEPAAGKIGLGDIVLFFNREALTVHRVVRVRASGGECRFTTKGDRAFNLDPGEKKTDELFGRVVGLLRGSRIFDLETGLHRRGGIIVATLSYVIGNAVRIAKRVVAS